MNIVVRAAQESDMAWLLTELEAFASFYGTKRSLMPESKEEASQKLLGLINQHLVLVAEHTDGTPLGFIAGFITPHFMNSEIITLSELFWWVKESARGSMAGGLLLKEFLAFGEAHADWITFTLEHHSPVSDKSLLKRGFRLQERSYLKEIF